MPVEYGAGPFQPVRSYDTPGLLISQIVEGEATWPGIRNTFLSKDRLSLKERTTYADGIKKRFGGGAMVGAVVDVATNPFVWLMFLTSGMMPRATDVLKKGGSLWSTKKGYSSYLRKEFGAHHTLGLTTSNQLTEGSLMPHLSVHMSDVVERAAADEARHLQGPIGEVLDGLRKQGLKVKSFDPMDHPPGPERDALQEIHMAMAVRMGGFEGERMRLVPEFEEQYVLRHLMTNVDGKRVVDPTKPLERLTGPVKGLEGNQQARKLYAEYRKQELLDMKAEWMKKEEETKRLMEGAGKKYRVKKWEAPFEIVADGQTVRETEAWEAGFKEWSPGIDATYQRYGLDKLEGSMRAAMQERIVKLVGDEGEWATTGRFKVDLNKAHKQAQGMQSRVMVGRGEIPSGSWQGAEAASKIVDVDTVRAYAEGRLSHDQWADVVEKLYRPAFEGKGHYLPRNVLDVVEVVDGVKLDGTQLADLVHDPVKYLAGDKRIAPLTERQFVFHPDDMDLGNSLWGHSDEAKFQKERSVAKANAMAKEGKPHLAYRLDAKKSFDRAFSSTRVGMAMYSEKLSPGLMQGIRETAGNRDPMHLQGKRFAPNLKTGKSVPYDSPLWDTVDDLPGLGGSVDESVSPAMLLEREYAAHQDPWVKEELVNVVIPAALGKTSAISAAQLSAALSAKKNLARFADGAVGKAIEKYGGTYGKEFTKGLRHLADPRRGMHGLGLSGNLAKYLYVTHLGLNMGSVALNMMQPLTLALPLLGSDNILKGYGQAMGEMLGYFGKRYNKYGFNPITEAQRLELMESSFKHMKVTGIKPGVGESLDSIMFSAERGGKSSLKQRLFFEYPMKFFEKSEWFNRSVVAYGVENAYKKAGRKVTDAAFEYDAARTVMETQFGNRPENMPRLFLKNEYFKNPLMRMFLSYPLRSAVGVFNTLPKAGGRGYWEGLGQTVITGMGTSAIVYEVGKNLGGIDLSRGLFAAAAGDLVGGRDLVEGNLPFQAPPVIDIPLGLMKGFAGGDLDVIRTNVARLLPAGVAINRALGVLPNQDGGITQAIGGMQKTYAGWGQRAPDGRVPVFKGDGSLIDYKSPAELVFRGLGADLGKFNSSAELDNFLVKNREEIVAARQKYMSAMAAGNGSGANAVAVQFKKRFGLPLTVSKAQWASFLKVREVPRSERILDRMPPAERGPYGQMLQQTGMGRLGLTGDQPLTGSSGSRRGEGATSPLPPLVRQALERMLRDGEMPGASQGQGLSPFQGYLGG